ncbi:hypothetical protein AX14_007729 [Amanita brunnescens Koide BX004]|nr:hypothetical protein AX14_007729 [Amanita brunnescens Koide BX004]
MYLKRHASGSLPPKKWTPGKADLRPTSLTGSSMAPYIYPALTDVGQTRAAGRLSIAHRPAFVKGDQERGRATNQTVEEDRRMELRAQAQRAQPCRHRRGGLKRALHVLEPHLDSRDKWPPHCPSSLGGRKSSDGERTAAWGQLWDAAQLLVHQRLQRPVEYEWLP